MSEGLSYTVVDASVRHVKPLSTILRPAACATLRAFGQDPRRALHRAFNSSSYCKTVLMDGQPGAMWGMHGTALSDHAFVWAAIGQNVVRFPLAIVRRARSELSVMRDKVGCLYATVQHGDARAFAFAQTLGFQKCDIEAENMTVMQFGAH